MRQTYLYYISFYEMIQNLIKEQEFLEISEIVDEVLQKSGYRDMPLKEYFPHNL
jgi:DNA helicase-2/ATP-dependent DNA helicase PcrA